MSLLMFICPIRIGAALAGFVFYLTGRIRIRKTWEVYTARGGDNIMGLAKNFNVNWKKLARINKIKSPFVLNEGQKLQVPKRLNSNQSLAF